MGKDPGANSPTKTPLLGPMQSFSIPIVEFPVGSIYTKQ